MCIFSHCVYKKSAKIMNFFETQKNPKKPNKTQKKPNPYPRKGQTGIGFFWVTPPPPPPILHHLLLSSICSLLRRVVNVSDMSVTLSSTLYIAHVIHDKYYHV